MTRPAVAARPHGACPRPAGSAYRTVATPAATDPARTCSLSGHDRRSSRPSRDCGWCAGPVSPATGPAQDCRSGQRVEFGGVTLWKVTSKSLLSPRASVRMCTTCIRRSSGWWWLVTVWTPPGGASRCSTRRLTASKREGSDTKASMNKRRPGAGGGPRRSGTPAERGDRALGLYPRQSRADAARPVTHNGSNQATSHPQQVCPV